MVFDLIFIILTVFTALTDSFWGLMQLKLFRDFRKVKIFLQLLATNPDSADYSLYLFFIFFTNCGGDSWSRIINIYFNYYFIFTTFKHKKHGFCEKLLF